jgi:hypothetical protein
MKLKETPQWLLWIAAISTTLNFIISLLRWGAHNIILWRGEVWFPKW